MEEIYFENNTGKILFDRIEIENKQFYFKDFFLIELLNQRNFIMNFFYFFIGTICLISSVFFLNNSILFLMFLALCFLFFILSIVVKVEKHLLKISILMDKDFVTNIKKKQNESAKLFVENVMKYKEINNKLENERKNTRM